VDTILHGRAGVLATIPKRVVVQCRADALVHLAQHVGRQTLRGPSTTLQTLVKAAGAVGKRVKIA
jgi:hypothetical protein